MKGVFDLLQIPDFEVIKATLEALINIVELNT